MRIKNAISITIFFVLMTAFILLPPLNGDDLADIKAQGNKLLDESQPWRALPVFEKGLEDHPDDVDLMIGAGKAAFLSGDASIAADHLYAAVQADSESFEGNLFLGRALKQQGKEMVADPMTQNDGYMLIQDSVNFLRKATEVEAKSPDACLELANTLYELYDLEGADAAAAEALQRKSGLIDALLLRGDVSFALYTQGKSGDLDAEEVQSRWAQGVDCYKKVCNRDKENTRAYLGLGGLYEWEQKWPEAKEAYLNTLLVDGENNQAFMRLLIIYGQNESLGVLSKELDKVLAAVKKRHPSEEPRQATALYYQGRALLQEGEYAGSIEALEKSAGLNEQFATCVSYYICRAAYGAEDLDRAADEVVGTMRSDPDGLVYFMQNDHEFSTKVYVPMRYVTIHLINAGRLEDAREFCGLLVRLVTGDHSLFNDYGLLCRDTGQFEEAYSAYSKALELEPQNPGYLNDCALILHYYLHRDMDRVKTMYEQAIEEANKLLENKAEMDPNTTEIVQTALQDATRNLELYNRGITEWQN
jgi:tetratricopeptide (TPR) repeat protein